MWRPGPRTPLRPADPVTRGGDAAAATSAHGGRAAASIYRYVLPLRDALMTGRGPITHRRGLLVCLRDSLGHVGWGEAAPLRGWHGPDLATTSEVLASWLRAASPISDPEALAPQADATLRGVPCAWAAIGGAVADLAARRRGTTLAAFLSGEASTAHDRLAGPVPTAALLDGETPTAVAHSAAAAVAGGFGTAKLKVGNRPLADDVARVGALREAAPGMALRLDANGAWGPEAHGAVEALGRFEPELVEEPCRGLDELRSLQARTTVPIAADESLPPLADLDRHLPLGVAVAVLKPSALGDPRAVLRAVVALRESGTEVVVGSFLESAVGLATAAHVAAVAGGPAAGLGTAALLLDDVCAPLPVRDGALWLSPEPGLGLTPDRHSPADLLEIGS